MYWAEVSFGYIPWKLANLNEVRAMPSENRWRPRIDGLHYTVYNILKVLFTYTIVMVKCWVLLDNSE